MDSGVRRATSDFLSSRRIQDVLSIAASDFLSSRRIQDVLSINHGGGRIPVLAGMTD